MEKSLSKQELEEKIKNLVGFEKRYYEFLPNPCWMSEENQAKALKVGRSKLKSETVKFFRTQNSLCSF